MEFNIFIKKYPISFLIPSMKLQSYRYAEYLQQFLTDSHLSVDIPDQNNKDILIIIPTKSTTFEEIHHSIFLMKNYEKFPKSIIIIVGFDNLISMINPFDFMSVLSSYKIPILYSSINDERIIIDIKLSHLNDYEDCINYTIDNKDTIFHIIHYNEFINNIKRIIKTKNTNNYFIYCYYSNENDKNEWIKIIDRYMKIVEFFYSILSSENMELKIKNNGLIVI